MKDMYKIFAMGALTLSPLAVMAGGDAPDGTHATTTQTQIRVDVDKDTSEVVLSKSDTTPDVLSKAFVLKHADPYEVRPYIMNAAGAVTIDDSWAPTRVEAARYEDGTGVIIVSAEDYRFEKQADGSLSIPELIEKIDRPGFTSSSGQPKWVYYCKHRSPEQIREVTNILFNSTKGGKTFESGKDKTAADTEINAVIFHAIPANMDKMKALIEEYDVPFDDINITVQVYEFEEENDMSIGTDYQAWVNDIGKDMLTFDTGAGARYFNFNPQWTTDYLDFLVSKGQGKVSTSLQATIIDWIVHEPTDAPEDFFGYFNLGSYITYTSTDAGENESITDAAWTALTGEGTLANEEPGAGNTVTYEYDGESSSTTEVTGNKTTDFTYEDQNGNGRTIQQALTKTIKKAHYGLEIGIEATAYGKTNQFIYNISNTNLIGYKSDGQPRTSLTQKTGEIMVNGDAQKFVIGGVEKKSVVKVVNKLPFLGSLPGIGWLFSSEDEIVKTSQVVTVVSFEFEGLNKGMDNNEINEAINGVKTAEAKPGFDQYLLDENKSISADTAEAVEAVKEEFNALVD